MAHDERLFSSKSESRTNNFLLEGPELVSFEEELKQEGELSFSFDSDTRRYYLGHQNGRPFFTVEYYDALPDSLTEDEKQKFKQEKRVIEGRECDVYCLSYGSVPEKKELGPVEESAVSEHQEYRVSPARDFEKGILERFFQDEANKEGIIKILRAHSDRGGEIAEYVEELFVAVRQKNRELSGRILNAFPKEAIKEIRAWVKELLLPKPREIEGEQLGEYLKSKCVLFYTGAGISMASGVPNMAELEQELQIDFSKETDGLLMRAIQRPEELVASWESFTKAAFESPATLAHRGLAKLATRLRAKIFTENVDHLQEKAGIKAIHVTGPWLRESVQEGWLKEIDVVVAAGLSFDDRGFLGWYKKQHPTGTIVALNIQQPSYLGSEDIFVRGDVQKTIPRLEETMVEQM